MSETWIALARALRRAKPLRPTDHLVYGKSAGAMAKSTFYLYRLDQWRTDILAVSAVLHALYKDFDPDMFQKECDYTNSG